MANKAKTEVVSSEVVVEIVPAPKAEYVVSVADAQQIDSIVDLFIDAEEHLFEGDVGMQNTAVAMSKVMGTSPSYAEWNTKRALWIRKFMAKTPSASDESAQKAWERLARRMLKECGLDKPKAPNKSAVKMSEKRKAEQEMLDHSAKEMGIKLKPLSSDKSQEPDETNTISPIAKRRPNKYGV